MDLSKYVIILISILGIRIEDSSLQNEGLFSSIFAKFCFHRCSSLASSPGRGGKQTESELKCSKVKHPTHNQKILFNSPYILNLTLPIFLPPIPNPACTHREPSFPKVTEWWWWKHRNVNYENHKIKKLPPFQWNHVKYHIQSLHDWTFERIIFG